MRRSRTLLSPGPRTVQLFRPRGTSGRVLAVLLALGVFAVVAIGSSSAAGTRTFTAVFDAGPLPGGTTHPHTSLVIHNTSSQKLGSAIVTAAAFGANSFRIIDATASQGTVDLSATPGQLKLSNLNLASDASMTVDMTVKPPCNTGSYTWGISAWQQGDFSGSTFTLQSGSSSNLSTSVSARCKLVWDTQPRSAVLNTQITGTDYNSAGAAVTVKALDGDNQPVTSSNASVQLNQVAGIFTSGGGFSGAQTTLSNTGTATFSSFKSTASASDLRITASAMPDFLSTEPSDPPFDISLVAARGCGNNCSLPATVLDQNPTAKASATLSGASAAFLALNNTPPVPQSVLDPLGGCAYFHTVGASGFEASDSRGSSNGQLTFTYYVNKKLIEKLYGKNQGQQFIPICAAAAQVDSQGQVIKCLAPGLGYGPWTGKALDSTGRFNGLTRDAVCDLGTGLYWGIMGSFQDYTNSDSSLVIDPAVNPTITGWGSDGTFRFFFGRAPAPWDFRATG
jgi:hypothetical protein